jgi:hypothetical protein
VLHAGTELLLVWGGLRSRDGRVLGADTSTTGLLPTTGSLLSQRGGRAGCCSALPARLAHPDASSHPLRPLTWLLFAEGHILLAVRVRRLLLDFGLGSCCCCCCGGLGCRGCGAGRRWCGEEGGGGHGVDLVG